MTLRNVLVAGAATLASTASIAAPIHINGSEFQDAQGRTLILRGVNLGGTSKIPAETSSDPKTTTFVGRPFPLSRADEHFRRLQSWGLTTERLIVTWEAIEHAGPGIYDHAYLDYLHALIRRGDRYGIKFVIDLHQDFYSRASGGDGAPYWTLTKLGLLPDRTNEPGAPQIQAKRGPGYWPPTAARFSVDTMDTLFWAGNDFAPGFKVDSVPVQDWLQQHYIGAATTVASKLRDLPNIIGFDTYNEPQSGFLGVQDLHQAEIFMLVIGHYAAPGTQTPTYWDLMQAAAGFAPDKPTVPVNQLWSSGSRDIWRRYGVWDVVDGKPKLLKPDYFAKIRGSTPQHNAYLAPFYLRLAQALRRTMPNAIIFEEPSAVGGGAPDSMKLGIANVAFEPHFYDSVTLLSKQSIPDTTLPIFAAKPIEGKDAVLKYYRTETDGMAATAKAFGGIPIWIGETGIPYDMNGKAAYQTGDFHAQEILASLMYQTLDRSLSSYAIWNYTSDNSNSVGDHWNEEDMSIFSADQQRKPFDINSGGRALKAVVRPYPVATAGTPLSISFDPDTKAFVYRFRADTKIKADTEIFVPKYQFPRGYNATVENGHYTLDDARSLLKISDAHDVVTVSLTPH